MNGGVGTFGRAFFESLHGNQFLQEPRVYAAVANITQDTLSICEWKLLCFGKFETQKAGVNRQLEQGDAARKIPLQVLGIATKQEDVVGVQPRLSKVDKLVALRQICHKRPQVHQSSAEGCFR